MHNSCMKTEINRLKGWIEKADHDLGTAILINQQHGHGKIGAGGMSHIFGFGIEKIGNACTFEFGHLFIQSGFFEF
jgi:hypothetical protein